MTENHYCSCCGVLTDSGKRDGLCTACDADYLAKQRGQVEENGEAHAEWCTFAYGHSPCICGVR